jgi:hypothetical protein
MRTGRGQVSTASLVVCLRRRQPDRLLGELGRDRRYPALDRERRGVVERGGDLGVGRVRRQGEVAGAGDRVVDDRRDPPVHAPAPRSQVAVEDRRQQRVGEPNRAVLALDHVGGGRRRQRVGRDPCPL